MVFNITQINAETLNLPLIFQEIDYEPAMAQIAIDLQTRAKEAIRGGGRGIAAFPDRANPNIPGIIDDLNKEASIKDSRFESQPVLQDSGRLLRSIVGRWGKDFAEAGSNVPYAQLQNEGGEVIIINEVPRLLEEGSKVVERELNALAKDYPEVASIIRNQPMIDWNVLARPYLDITDEDIDEAMDVLITFLQTGAVE